MLGRARRAGAANCWGGVKTVAPNGPRPGRTADAGAPQRQLSRRNGVMNGAIRRPSPGVMSDILPTIYR